MNKFIQIILFLGLTACTNTSGVKDDEGWQSKKIYIDDSEVVLDFGMLPDSVELVNQQFVIHNNGLDTVRITRIDKTCGCTQLQLSNPVIAPDDSVSLDMKVEIESYYSFFEREISIYTDSRKSPLVIYLRASRQLPEYQLKRDFPVKVSDRLRIDTPYVIMGYVTLGEAKVSNINILNNSDEESSFEVYMDEMPSYFSFYYDDTLGPNEIGRITMMIDLSKIDYLWGLQRRTLCIREINSGIEKEVPLEAIFVEKLDMGADDTPRLMVPITDYTINTAHKSEVEFSLQNIGNNKLYIRDIQMSTSQRIHINSREIDAGDEVKLLVFINPLQKDDIEIGITTNDPIEPYKMLRVYCNPLD